MKRVFIGIKISDTLRTQVYNWQKFNFDLPVRFLSRKNLHITLISPWYIHEENLPALKSKLCEFRGNLKPFEISFGRLALGPDPREPRLIWALGETSPDLIHLKDLVENKISLLDSRQPFLLHLTVARLMRGIPVPRIEEPVHWRETVSALALYESMRDLAGVEYVELEEILF